MKVGIFADGNWGLNLLKILYFDKNFNLEFVVLRNKQDQNILNFCKKKKITSLKFKNINENKSINILKKFNADIFVSMSYNQIFKKKFLNKFKIKIINCHAGALPFYRGRSPINWAVINGEKKIGITTHLINSKIDEGDIFDQQFIKINNQDNFKTILEKCYKKCPSQLYKVLKKIKKQKIELIKQSAISKTGSYYFKRKPGDEIINFDNNFKNINNFIRGLVYPSVGASFFYKKKIYNVTETALIRKTKRVVNLSNGYIFKVSKKKLNVKVNDSIIELRKIYFKKNKVYVKDLSRIFKKNTVLNGSNV